MPRIKNETSNNDRQRIVDSYLNGMDVNSISDVLVINMRTARSIIKVYVTEDRIDKKLRGGIRNKKLSCEQKNLIRSWVDDDCSITLRAIKEKVLSEFGISICEKTADRVMKEFHYSLKRTSLIPVRRNDLDVVDKRAEYARNLLNILSTKEPNQLYYVDEAGFKVMMRVRRGRSPKGTRAVHVVPGLRTRNISLCSVMNKEGLFLYETSSRPYNSKSFFIFRYSYT